MNTKVDTAWTTVDRYESTKKAAKEFKEIYTDNDLMVMFGDQSGTQICGEVLKSDVEFWDNGTLESDIHLLVKIVVEWIDEIRKVSFMMNKDFKIIGEYNIKVYKEC